MSSDTASKDISLNSSTSLSELTRDEDVLKLLKLQESDLDHFAAYFELAFQGNTRSLTVLVALLQRLCGVEALRQQKQSGIWIEDVVGRLTRRLYTRCESGQEAASRFGTEASEQAEQIFSEALPVPSEL